jgi:hypothetical protein
MRSLKTIIRISTILIILISLGGLLPAASAVFDTAAGTAPTCCPVFADYPDYPYPVDPYYQFPMACSCPFLDDMLERFENWDIPYAYWEYVIQNQNSSCSTCSGSTSTVTTFSYSTAPIIIPEKDSVMSAYEKISISTAIKSKDQVIGNYQKQGLSL